MWLTLARVLAKEAQYRARRRYGRRAYRLARSMLLSSLLSIFMFTAISLGLSSAVAAVPAEARVEASIWVLGVLGVFEMFIGGFTMASTLQVLLADRLLDFITPLPVRESDVRKALLALVVIWGGVAMLFLVVPGAALAGYLAGSIGVFAGGVAEAAFCLLMAAGLGYLAGSVSPKATRRPLIRAASTLVWLLVFFSGFMFNFVSRLAERLELEPLGPLLQLTPPFCIVAAGASGGYAALSSACWMLASLLVFKAGARRFWRAVAAGEALLAAEAKVSGWRLWRGLLPASLRKDLTLLSRTPRVLASTIGYMAFPALYIMMSLTEAGAASRFMAAILFFFGGLTGLSAQYLYSLEGEGAKLLYHLPVRRGGLAFRKACTTMLLLAPLSLMVLAAIGYFSGAAAGLLAFLSYMLSSSSSTLLTSYLAAKEMPDEPTAWTPQTISAATRVVVMIGMLVLYGGLAAALAAIGFFISWLAASATAALAGLLLLAIGVKAIKGLSSPL